MRISLALGLLVAATPVPAAAQEICASLDRLLQASREVPAFVSLQAALDRGEPPMHWSSSDFCAVEPGVSVRCWRGSGLPVEWEGIEACPGLVPAEPRSDRNRRRRSIGGPSYKAYIVSGLRLEYGSGCTVCVVVHQSFSITFAGPTHPNDRCC